MAADPTPSAPSRAMADPTSPPRGYEIGPDDLAAFAALDPAARRGYVETSGGLEAWLANRAARRIPHTDADAVLATLNIAYGEPDPVDAAMAVALRRAFRRTLDASVPPSLKPSPCSVALPSGDNPSRKRYLLPARNVKWSGQKS